MSNSVINKPNKVRKGHPIFIELMFGVIGIISVSTYCLSRSEKPKEEFIKVEGVITYLKNSYKQFPARSSTKFRYLMIDKSERVFEIFIGKEAGDFKPDLEKID